MEVAVIIIVLILALGAGILLILASDWLEREPRKKLIKRVGKKVDKEYGEDLRRLR